MMSNKSRNLELLKKWTNEEWAVALAPLASTSYFDDIVTLTTKVYDDLTYPSISPTKKLNVFMPLKLSQPSEIHTVIFNYVAPFSAGANGIGFGSSAQPTLTLTEIKSQIEERLSRKVLMDPTLISWLKQGVLVLNYAPIVGIGSASTAGCFDYFYKNVLSVIDQYTNKHLAVVSTTSHLETLIEDMKLPKSMVHIKNGRFTTGRLDKNSRFVLDILDEFYESTNRKPVVWYT